MRVIPRSFSLTAVAPYVQIHTGRCALTSCVHGGDGASDYELVVYDYVGAAPAGTETQLCPQIPYNAGAQGANGSEKNYEADVSLGIWVGIYDDDGTAYTGVGPVTGTIEFVVG